MVQQLNIFGKKRKLSRECNIHPNLEVFPIRKLGKQRIREVQVFWTPCHACGKTWPSSWEPNENVQFTNVTI
ncbi:hypothetical protein MATL_G00257960 [Megalops atlanticus]|uniref:Uncharacterized protein n=1 Tax=Megalops atlanticus TaxID=7932 RepID=A0A9D3SU77_MEGAT|nr:hypothetical protein MATL_G00257960 [Megalops atlanticus]